jgi:hypothetical protein
MRLAVAEKSDDSFYGNHADSGVPGEAILFGAQEE